MYKIISALLDHVLFFLQATVLRVLMTMSVNLQHMIVIPTQTALIPQEVLFVCAKQDIPETVFHVSI